MLNAANYDLRWKELIEELFEDFLLYFLPDFYPQVDINKGFVFLDQELDDLLGSYTKKGLVVADKLVQVSLKDGSIKWIVIHIEIQSSDEKDFSERMFVYFVRLYEKYGKKIMSFAVYTGYRVPKNYKEFVYELGETKLKYEFGTYLAKEKTEKELLKSDNPFALAVLAGKYVSKSKGKELSLYRAKIELIKLARLKNYDKRRINNLIKFVYFLIKLPNLESQFQNEVNQLIKPSNMDTLTPEQKKDGAAFANAVYEAVHGKSVDEILAEKDEKIAEKDEMIIKLLLKSGTSLENIVKKLDVSEDLFLKIKKTLNKP